MEAIEQIVNGGIEQPEADERGALIGGELRRMGTRAPTPGVALTADQRQQIERARRVLIWSPGALALALVLDAVESVGDAAKFEAIVTELTPGGAP